MFTSLSFRRFVELPAVDDRPETTPLLIAANSPLTAKPVEFDGFGECGLS